MDLSCLLDNGESLFETSHIDHSHLDNQFWLSTTPQVQQTDLNNVHFFEEGRKTTQIFRLQ